MNSRDNPLPWGPNGERYSNSFCTDIDCFIHVWVSLFTIANSRIVSYRIFELSMLIHTASTLGWTYLPFLEQYMNTPVSSCFCQYRMLLFIWNLQEDRWSLSHWNHCDFIVENHYLLFKIYLNFFLCKMSSQLYIFVQFLLGFFLSMLRSL